MIPIILRMLGGKHGISTPTTIAFLVSFVIAELVAVRLPNTDSSLISRLVIGTLALLFNSMYWVVLANRSNVQLDGEFLSAGSKSYSRHWADSLRYARECGMKLTISSRRFADSAPQMSLVRRASMKQ